MNVFTKQPNEKIPFSMNYVNLLNDTETISSVSVVAYDSINADVTSTIVHNTSIVGDLVKVVAKGGANGTSYKISISVTSSEGNVYEEDVFVNVYET